MSYNNEPRNSTLTEVLEMAPAARQDAIVAYFHKASAQHNALMSFTSTFDPNQQNGGVTSIFCEKTDLSAGGKSRVHFNTIGMPAGPGAVGAGQLTGNESKSSIGNYSASVDWIRDAVSLTQDEIEMIEAGRNLKAIMKQLLARKMGLTKQNHGLMRLIRSATAVNTYRVGNRSNTNALTADDTLSLEVGNTTRALLNTVGATPLKKSMSKPGCPVSKFMLFAGDQALLPIRNDSSFNTAMAAVDVRGVGNTAFTGELLDWQGNSIYEFPISDMAWDDYKGGPLLAKARVRPDLAITNPNAALVTPASTGAALDLVVNPSNTLSRYFQFFDGHPWQFSRQEELPNYSGSDYYAWACNPDGSRCFFSYAGLNGLVGGNKLTVKAILSPGSGGIKANTVGQLTTGTNALDANPVSGRVTTAEEFLGGGDSNLPASGTNGTWYYSNTIDNGAVILQANSQGVVYARSFMLAGMAALFAHGRVKMAEIEQNFDYDYVMGNGFQMIFGTGVVLDPMGNPNGYIMIEHALDVIGYPCPSLEV